MERQRLDIRLAGEKNISRETARRLILSGKVKVNGTVILKTGLKLKSEDTVEAEVNIKYVSRGGYKLEKAIDFFEIDLTGKICMDIGASTGGFTDCMLQNGAAKVFAVDVGHGQLAGELLSDERVCSMEGINIKQLENFNEQMDFVSADVSFISVTKIFHKIYEILKHDSCALCLIKPQFEAGRGNISKGGIVKNPRVHKRVLEEVVGASVSGGFSVMGLTFSPIEGMDGNIEYLLYLKKKREAVK